MEYLEYYKDVWRKFAVFSGRSGRAEFWYFVLINFIVVILIGIVDGVLNSVMNSNASFIGSLYSLAVFVPSLAVAFRRLHDVGKSGWWLLLALVPFVGWIILIVFYAMAGEKTSNKFGDVPTVMVKTK